MWSMGLVQQPSLLPLATASLPDLQLLARHFDWKFRNLVIQQLLAMPQTILTSALHHLLLLPLSPQNYLISPSPLVHSSSFSAPSPFFSSSFSPSAHSSSPPQPSLPPASPFTHPEAIFAMHQTSATVHPADPSQFIIKDSTFQEALECNSHRWQGNTAYLPSHNSDALNELGQDN
ncbi:uncharacterized protein LOC135111798 isoform X1 [Scylla paramamosain]|uniref:uncharacterized protein LOC135111798 isoform X1 n=1 Tax=Scylla paramamosain TaxID=85552 RepID=UPI00308279AD